MCALGRLRLMRSIVRAPLSRGKMLVVVPLLSRRNRNLQAVLLWRQRAGCIGSIGAGRVFQSIEVQPELPGLVQTLIGKCRVQESRSSVSRGLAGRISQDEEKLFVLRRLKHRLQSHCLAVDYKFRHSRYRHLDRSSEDRRDLHNLCRSIRDPSRGNLVFLIRRIPLEPVKLQPGRRMRIFETKGIPLSAMNYKHAECSHG